MLLQRQDFTSDGSAAVVLHSADFLERPSSVVLHVRQGPVSSGSWITGKHSRSGP